MTGRRHCLPCLLPLKMSWASKVGLNANATAFPPLTETIIAPAPVPIPAPLSPPPPKQPRPDPFVGLYPQFLALAFGRLRANQYADVFPALVMMYQQNPSSFSVISNLHQNNKEDSLHFSIQIQNHWATYKVHIYGWWYNTFIITHMTYILTTSRDHWSDPALLAQFEIQERDESDALSDK